MINNIAAIAPTTKNKELHPNHPTLVRYLLENENINPFWFLQSQQYDPVNQLTIWNYILVSQTWPKPAMSAHSRLWKHSLIIYQPNNVKSSQALLYINGGTRYPSAHEINPPAQSLNFAHIAARTHSIVIDLQDIPNQYIALDDNVLRMEDSIIAYTFKRFMDNPNEEYWPLYLPMTKAVIKAMDAAQQILNHKNTIQIDSFVVAGASKRGLTTWLATLVDERIQAIIPIVFDLLNTKINLKHIHECYNHQWPPAFLHYIREKIPDGIHTAEFTKLMNIQDPIAYLTNDQNDFFKKRLAIPKYLISVSGDDFSVPDSLNLYLDKLTGETQIRIIPNQSHYVDNQIIEQSILAYYQTIVDQQQRPTLQWQVNANRELQKIITNQQPSVVKLWEAENQYKRDFRLVANIRYIEKELSGQDVDNVYQITIDPPNKGWKASFVEASFPGSNGHHFILTTPVYVVGHTHSQILSC